MSTGSSRISGLTFESLEQEEHPHMVVTLGWLPRH